MRGKLGNAKNSKKLGLACFSKFEGFQWFEEVNGLFLSMTELVKKELTRKDEISEKCFDPSTLLAIAFFSLSDSLLGFRSSIHSENVAI